MLYQTEVRKLLLEHFICWSEEMPTLSVTDCGSDEDSQSFTFAVRFHRFVFNYQFPVDAINKENVQQVLHSAVVSLERTIAEAYYQHNYGLVISHKFGQRKVLSQATAGLFDLSTTKISGISIEPIDKLAFALVAKSEESSDESDSVQPC